MKTSVYQVKIDDVLKLVKCEMLEMKRTCTKLELGLRVGKNVTDKLCRQISVIEQRCNKNEQYSRREGLEFLNV